MSLRLSVIDMKVEGAPGSGGMSSRDVEGRQTDLHQSGPRLEPILLHTSEKSWWVMHS